MRSKVAFEKYKPMKVKPATLKNDKMLKEKIDRAINSIRKKYLALKLGKADEDETLNRLLKPVIDPLKVLNNISSSSIPSKHLKRVKKEEVEEDDEGSPAIYRSNLEEYFRQYPSLARQYIEGYFVKRNQYDEKYGVQFNFPMNRLYMGNKELKIDQDSKIIIDDNIFDGSDGLYSLIFMKHPMDYSKQDLIDYKNILQLTSAHKRNYDPSDQIAGTRASKYTRIIKPLFKSKNIMFNQSQTEPPSGSGMMVYNEKPIEYIYWDDVNELVDRLRLLNSSKLAGNTDSHDNEILSIISELREAGIIA